MIVDIIFGDDADTLKCLYEKFPMRIDIAGSIESISKIDPDILYKCYNTFYNPSNMAMVVCGDFEPEELLKEVKKRLIDKKANGESKINTFIKTCILF